MEINDRLTQLEAELKVLKNEVLAVLLDVKEKMLDKENPFSTPQPRMEIPSITIARAAPAPVEPSRKKAPVPDEDACEREPARAQPVRAATGWRAETAYERPEPAPVINPAPSRMPPERREQPPLRQANEITRAFRLFETTENITEQAPAFQESLPLASLAGMVAWTENTVYKLGSERTQIILDVSEMMGQLPAELKMVLEKIINKEEAKNPEKVYARDYLNALKELAGLLGSKNTADFVALHIVSHGLNALARNTQNG